MFLTVPGASAEQLQSGVAAAYAYLASKGASLEQVVRAQVLYENWVEGCRRPGDRAPEEGADTRRVFSQADRVAIEHVRKLMGAQWPSGHCQLEAYEYGPTQWP